MARTHQVPTMKALDYLHLEKRRPGPAYALWAGLGLLGAHRIYLRRPWGYLQGGLTITGAALCVLYKHSWGVFFSFPWVGSLGPWWFELFNSILQLGIWAIVIAALWAIVDSFRIQRWLEDADKGRTQTPSSTSR